MPDHRALGGPLSRRLFLKALASAAGAIACQRLGLLPPATSTNPTSPPGIAPPSPIAASPPPSPPDPTATDEATATPGAYAPRLIVDGHQDVAWNWLEFGRDPTESALAGRAREAGTPVAATVGGRTSGLPEWIQGRVGIVLASVFVMPLRRAYGQWRKQVYATPAEAFVRASQQMDAYKALAADEPRIRLILTRDDLNTVVASWNVRDSEEAGAVGLVLSMEGADPIQEPAQAREWYARGLRGVGLAWAATRYAGGAGEPGPLTDLGRELLAVMAEIGMLLDLSHMAEEAYLQSLDLFPGVVIASHSNPRAYLPTDRGLSDEMIRRLAAREGVVGVVPYNRFLKPGWQTGDPREAVSVRTVAEAIDYVAQLTGSSAHVAIGSDFDGGFGVESIPAEMDTIADLAQIAEALLRRGYQAADIEAIMNGNWLRILRRSLPA